MKGHDYKNLKSLVVDDQTEVEKMKNKKQVKDSSKPDLVKNTTKLTEESVKGNNVEVKVVHFDGPEVLDKGLEENKLVEGPIEVLEKKKGEKEVEKEKEVEGAWKSFPTEKKKGAEALEKSASMAFGDNPSSGAVQANKAILCYHEGKLCSLDHVFFAPNIGSLWNADLTSPQFV